MDGRAKIFERRRRMKKRMLAWVLCLLMALTVVPTGVFAAQQPKPNYGSSYDHIDVKTDAV